MKKFYFLLLLFFSNQCYSVSVITRLCDSESLNQKLLLLSGSFKESKSSVLEFLKLNGFEKTKDSLECIYARKSFRFYEYDSLSYEVIYNFNLNKFKIHDLRLVSRRFESYCEIEEEGSRDYKLLFHHFLDQNLYELFTDEEKITEKKLDPFLLNKNINRLVVYISSNGDTLSKYYIKYHYEIDDLVEKYSTVNPNDIENIVTLFNDNSYLDEDRTWCFVPDVYFLFYKDSIEYAFIEFVLDCGLFRADLNSIKMKGKITDYDVLKDIQNVFTKMGQPEEVEVFWDDYYNKKAKAEKLDMEQAKILEKEYYLQLNKALEKHYDI